MLLKATKQSLLLKSFKRFQDLSKQLSFWKLATNNRLTFSKASLKSVSRSPLLIKFTRNNKFVINLSRRKKKKKKNSDQRLEFKRKLFKICMHRLTIYRPCNVGARFFPAFDTLSPVKIFMSHRISRWKSHCMIRFFSFFFSFLHEFLLF